MLFRSGLNLNLFCICRYTIEIAYRDVCRKRTSIRHWNPMTTSHFWGVLHSKKRLKKNTQESIRQTGWRSGYLVVLDEDAEDHHGSPRGDGDVAPVWAEVLDGRVGTSRDLPAHQTQTTTRLSPGCGLVSVCVPRRMYLPRHSAVILIV